MSNATRFLAAVTGFIAGTLAFWASEQLLRRPTEPPPESRPAAAAEPAAGEDLHRGTLEIDAHPRAEVYLGRTRVGRTPLEFVLEEGPHSLVLHPEGDGPAAEVRLTVVANETVRYVHRFSRQLIVADVEPAGYQLGVLARGVPAYVDRDFRYNLIPEALDGLTCLRTANDDRNEDLMVSFNVNREVRVYVAHDRRIGERPEWLRSFQNLRQVLMVLEGRTQTVYSIYARDFPAGRVTLGRNADGRPRRKPNMYLVFFRPLDES